MEKKILVIDDEEPIRETFERALKNKGYSVFSTKDAESAIELLKLKDIHVMFLDLKLPGMSGVDLCRLIRKERPIDIINAITGYTSLFDLADCRDAGFDDYFPKPMELKTLWKAAEDSFEKLARWKGQQLC